MKLLKDRFILKRKKLCQSEKTFNEFKKKNQNIVQPFEKVKSEVEQLRLDCIEFQSEKKLYNERKREFRIVEGKLKDLQWKHEVLFQRFEILEKEGDEIKSELEKSILQEKQMNNLHSLILEEKKKEFHDILEHYYNEMMARRSSDNVTQQIAQKIMDLLKGMKMDGEVKSKDIY